MRYAVPRHLKKWSILLNNFEAICIMKLRIRILVQQQRATFTAWWCPLDRSWKCLSEFNDVERICVHVVHGPDPDATVFWKVLGESGFDLRVHDEHVLRLFLQVVARGEDDVDFLQLLLVVDNIFLIIATFRHWKAIRIISPHLREELSTLGLGCSFDAVVIRVDTESTQFKVSRFDSLNIRSTHSLLLRHEHNPQAQGASGLCVSGDVPSLEVDDDWSTSLRNIWHDSRQAEICLCHQERLLDCYLPSLTYVVFSAHALLTPTHYVATALRRHRVDSYPLELLL
mmetsp:Transcript_31615/g.55854  ORF Transcript_31615/g.55854 Transcript_31615/m.55854 type:complete len:285 (+) Transcript_31615:6436-7290(+)